MCVRERERERVCVCVCVRVCVCKRKTDRHKEPEERLTHRQRCTAKEKVKKRERNGGWWAGRQGSGREEGERENQTEGSRGRIDP